MFWLNGVEFIVVKYDRLALHGAVDYVKSGIAYTKKENLVFEIFYVDITQKNNFLELISTFKFIK